MIESLLRVAILSIFISSVSAQDPDASDQSDKKTFEDFGLVVLVKKVEGDMCTLHIISKDAPKGAIKFAGRDGFGIYCWGGTEVSTEFTIFLKEGRMDSVDILELEGGMVDDRPLKFKYVGNLKEMLEAESKRQTGGSKSVK